MVLLFVGIIFDPPLCSGVTNSSLKIAGNNPSSRLFLKIIASGALIYSLVFIRNIVGMPSGLATELFFKFPIAFEMSSFLNIMSTRSFSSILFISFYVPFIVSFISLN